MEESTQGNYSNKGGGRKETEQSKAGGHRNKKTKPNTTRGNNDDGYSDEDKDVKTWKSPREGSTPMTGGGGGRKETEQSKASGN